MIFGGTQTVSAPLKGNIMEDLKMKIDELESRQEVLEGYL